MVQLGTLDTIIKLLILHHSTQYMQYFYYCFINKYLYSIYKYIKILSNSFCVLLHFKFLCLAHQYVIILGPCDIGGC